MEFAVFWASPDLIPLLQAIASADSHRVLGWFDSAVLESELRRLFPTARPLATPTATRSPADASFGVIVGNGGAAGQREDVLRELARGGIPMMLVQPPCSAILAFELDMIQRDTGALMVPFHPPATHPAVSMLADWIRSDGSPVGTIEQISFQRTLRDRGSDAVQAALAQDGLILRALLGNFQQVSALQAQGGDEALANLSVQLIGDYPALTRWAVGPVLDEPGGELTVVGNHGRATLQMPDVGPWTLARSGQPIALPDYDATLAIQQQLEALAAERAAFPTWEDACRAIDFADLATESVRRGRTLSVHNQRLTEEDTFKSMMAAGGCFILMLLPCILLAASLVEGLRLPSRRTVTVSLAAREPSVPLPTDLRKVASVHLSDRPDVALRMLSPALLDERLIDADLGRPEACAVGDDELMFAPRPDQNYRIVIAYDGAFALWRGWPMLLLLPIGLFLAMQLLKLAFPRRGARK